MNRYIKLLLAVISSMFFMMVILGVTNGKQQDILALERAFQALNSTTLTLDERIVTLARSKKKVYGTRLAIQISGSLFNAYLPAPCIAADKEAERYLLEAEATLSCAIDACKAARGSHKSRFESKSEDYTDIAIDLPTGPAELSTSSTYAYHEDIYGHHLVLEQHKMALATLLEIYPVAKAATQTCFSSKRISEDDKSRDAAPTHVSADLQHSQIAEGQLSPMETSPSSTQVTAMDRDDVLNNSLETVRALLRGWSDSDTLNVVCKIRVILAEASVKQLQSLALAKRYYADIVHVTLQTLQERIRDLEMAATGAYPDQRQLTHHPAAVSLLMEERLEYLKAHNTVNEQFMGVLHTLMHDIKLIQSECFSIRDAQ